MSKVSKELIESYRKIVIPFVAKQLYNMNFEEQGALDRAEFEQDCNEILDLAISALHPTGDLIWKIRQEAAENALKKAEEMYKRPKGKWIGDCYNPECDQCHTKPLEEFCDSLGLDGGSYVSIPMFFCPNCGAYMRKGEEEYE